MSSGSVRDGDRREEGENEGNSEAQGVMNK